MEIIAITNRKGGVGKTATAHAIGAGLIKRGYKVLFIDLDSQCNLTFIQGVKAVNITSMDVLTGRETAQNAIIKTQTGDIIPAGVSLANADAIINDTGKEYRLKEALEPIKGNYDFIIIDTPPALSTVTVNALTVADNAIIPVQADVLSLQGIAQLFDTVSTVKKYCNPKLHIKGIVITRYSGRAIISQDMKENIKNVAAQINTKVYKTPIRECTAIKEAQATQQNIFDYAPKSNASVDYNSLINEMLEE